ICSRASGKYWPSQVCSLRSWRLFILAKAFSKFAECSCHAGSFVSGASGEFFGSGIPARKRAVSSGGGCALAVCASAKIDIEKIAQALIIFAALNFFIGQH